MVTILFTSKVPDKDSHFLWYDISLFTRDEIDDLESTCNELIATICNDYQSGVKPREFNRKELPPGHIELNLDVTKQKIIKIRRSSKKSTEEEEELINVIKKIFKK